MTLAIGMRNNGLPLHIDTQNHDLKSPNALR